MNKRIAEGIDRYVDEIIGRWQVSLKEEKEERSLHYMPEHLVDKTSREFVEKSVDDSMFISMFYGKYDARKSSFSYASAGHESAQTIVDTVYN